jgi:DNA-binding transcriptional regulator LsrR (DeoR family)
MVQECHRAGKEEVHIGFAAGLSMLQLAQAFADLLCERVEDLPRKIVLVALVTGYEAGSPTTDPNSFFTYFLNRPLRVQMEFVGLHAPTIIRSEQISRLRKNREIADAFAESERLDIIATSGADWSDGHSWLRTFMQGRSQESLDELIRAGATADLLWQPLGEHGPLDEQTACRALTLIELRDLPTFVKDGKQVLLMLGPCCSCKRPKGRVLQSVLGNSEPMVTHIVVDSRTGLSCDGSGTDLATRSQDQAPTSHDGDRRARAHARPVHREWIELDERMLAAAFCEVFMENKTARQMAEEVQEEYDPPGHMTREKPLAWVRYAAARGWFRYRAPAHVLYERYIQDHYENVKRVRIAHTCESEHVARVAADTLLRLVQQCFRSGKTKEVHIGLDSGVAMRQFAQAFADVLSEPAQELPGRICFHSMVSAFDPGYPTTDARTFCSYFLDRSTLQVEVRFVSLHAPTIVTPEDIQELREIPEIEDSFREAEKLDIVVTSGSVWDHEHSSLRSFMARSEPALEQLRAAGTVGDVLWRPIGETHPVEAETAIRTFTIMELSQLQEFVRSGKHVLFMLGPCGKCNEPRGRLLQALLNQKQPLISHLVADSRSARQFIGFTKGEEWVRRECDPDDSKG